MTNGSDSIVEQPKWIKLIDTMDYIYDFITCDGDIFYFRTNHNAPNYRLISMNVNSKEIKEIIAEDKNDILESVIRVYHDYFAVQYLSHVKSVLYLFEMRTGQQLRKFDLPIGNIGIWYVIAKENKFFSSIFTSTYMHDF